MRVAPEWGIAVVAIFILVAAIRMEEDTVAPVQKQLQPDIVCLDGVEYYKYQRGTAGFMTVRFTQDSKVVTCGSE